MTTKLLKDINPDYLVYCYDHKEGSFRNEMSESYKANRTEMPEDLVPQIAYMKKMTDLLGICSIEMKGFEADDLIGTLACRGREMGLDVVIVSGDKDFAQLITPHIVMYDTMRDVRYTEDYVFEKWGVHPKQFIDYLAIVGDSSDNIQGVKGIGQKGAAKLLSDYKSLDGIYEHIDEISSKATVKKLIEGKESAYLAQELVTIKTDVKIDIAIEDFKLRPVNEVELRNILRELNFRNFERSLLGEDRSMESTDPLETAEASGESFSVGESFAAPKDVTLDMESLEKWLKEGDKVWAHKTDRALLLVKDNELACLDISPDELGPLFSRKKLKWEGYDLKSVWRHYNVIDPDVALWDGQLAAYVVRAGDKGNFEKAFYEFCGESLPQLAAPHLTYAAHLKLKAYLQEELDKTVGTKVYERIELPLAPILLDMEQRGIRLDVPLLAEESEELRRDLAEIEKKIFELAGEEFNIGSPKQLGVILFEKLNLPTGKKTKTGFSTDNEVLVKLSADYPIAQQILNYRELAKLKSTYVDAFPTLINPWTGRVHSCFNQALTTTGRLSSTNPNLQNLPIKTERGSRIRQAIVTNGGYSLVSADYSQIELRILAHITNDPGLCRAFEMDSDIHRATAAEIFSIKPESVTPEHRRKAKAVNFGIAYGQGAFGLAETLGISRGEAKEIIDRYFTRFAGVRKYMDETIEMAKDKGYVKTLFGRRRYIPEMQSKSGMQRKFGERAAINAPIQGSAADIVKIAMIQVAKKVDLQMLLQVHDELVLEGPTVKCKEQFDNLISIMESAVKLNVPLKVSGGIGENWAKAH